MIPKRAMVGHAYASLLCLILAILCFPVLAQDAEEDSHQLAIQALLTAENDIAEMVFLGFQVTRPSDILNATKQQFEAQEALMRAGGTPDFSLVSDFAVQIAELRFQAETLNDELHALEDTLSARDTQSEAPNLLRSAYEEFADERYENVAPLIEQAHRALAEEQALETRMRAILTSNTGYLDFLREIAPYLVAGVLFLFSIGMLFSRQRRIISLGGRIRTLQFERGIYARLIGDTQQDYFHRLKIPEQLFHIRISKYGELIHDIDRNIPVLEEQRDELRGRLGRLLPVRYLIGSLLLMLSAAMILVKKRHPFSLEDVLGILSIPLQMFMGWVRAVGLVRLLLFLAWGIVLAAILWLLGTLAGLILKRRREYAAERKKADEVYYSVIYRWGYRLKRRLSRLVKRIKKSVEIWHLTREKREEIRGLREVIRRDLEEHRPEKKVLSGRKTPRSKRLK